MITLINTMKIAKRILKDNCWLAEDLQKILDKSREYQIEKDFEKWVNLHNPFFEVINFIEELQKREMKDRNNNHKKGKYLQKKFLSN